MNNIIDKIHDLNTLEPKNLLEKTLKASEELGELSEAVLSSSSVSGNKYKKKTKDDVAEEAVDLAIMSLSIALDIKNIDEVKSLFDIKINKWQKNINS